MKLGRIALVVVTIGVCGFGGAMVVPIGAGEGPLGARLAGDVILLWRERGTPFLVGLDDLLLRRGSGHISHLFVSAGGKVWGKPP